MTALRVLGSVALMIVLSGPLSAQQQIYELQSPDGKPQRVRGTVESPEGRFEFSTSSARVLLPANSKVRAVPVDAAGQPLPGSRVMVRPGRIVAPGETAVQAPESVVAESQPSIPSNEDGALPVDDGQDAEYDYVAFVDDDPAARGDAGGVGMEKRGRAARGLQIGDMQARVFAGREGVEADGGISEYTGLTDVLGFGVSVESAREQRDDLFGYFAFAGHSSSYDIEESVEGTGDLGNSTQDATISNLELGLGGGIADLVGLSASQRLGLRGIVRRAAGLDFTLADDASGAMSLNDIAFWGLALGADYHYKLGNNLFKATGEVTPVGFGGVNSAFAMTGGLAYERRLLQRLGLEFGAEFGQETLSTEVDCVRVTANCEGTSTSTRTIQSIYISVIGR